MTHNHPYMYMHKNSNSLLKTNIAENHLPAAEYVHIVVLCTPAKHAECEWHTDRCTYAHTAKILCFKIMIIVLHLVIAVDYNAYKLQDLQTNQLATQYSVNMVNLWSANFKSNIRINPKFCHFSVQLSTNWPVCKLCSAIIVSPWIGQFMKWPTANCPTENCALCNSKQTSVPTNTIRMATMRSWAVNSGILVL